MNQFNDLHGEQPNELPRQWNIQPPESHLKSRKSPPNTRPLVSYIMGILNHHGIDNGDVEVHTSEISVESNSESVPDTYTTTIK